MKTELISSRDALEDFAPTWRQLHAQTQLSPFHSYEWAAAWLRHLGTRGEPCILTAGSPPTAFLPLFLHKARGLRIATFIGHGKSDYSGAIYTKDERESLSALHERLAQERKRFHAVLLRSLPAPWPVPEPRISPALRLVSRRYDLCPRIETGGSFDSYLKTRKKKFRANLKRTERQAAQYPNLAVQQEPCNKDLFQELLAVERESWKWQRGLSMLRDPATHAFLYEISTSVDFSTELWTCRSDGLLIAFALVLRDTGTRYYYLPSFRISYPDSGTFLLSQIVRATFEENIHCFDFLQGDESYKLSWATQSKMVYESLLAPRNPLGSSAFCAFRARWWAARSKPLQKWNAAVRSKLQNWKS